MTWGPNRLQFVAVDLRLEAGITGSMGSKEGIEVLKVQMLRQQKLPQPMLFVSLPD